MSAPHKVYIVQNGVCVFQHYGHWDGAPCYAGRWLCDFLNSQDNLACLKQILPALTTVSDPAKLHISQQDYNTCYDILYDTRFAKVFHPAEFYRHTDPERSYPAVVLKALTSEGISERDALEFICSTHDVGYDVLSTLVYIQKHQVKDVSLYSSLGENKDIAGRYTIDLDKNELQMEWYNQKKSCSLPELPSTAILEKWQTEIEQNCMPPL